MPIVTKHAGLRIICLALPLLVLIGATAPSPFAGLDDNAAIAAAPSRFGGHTGLQVGATGFFRTANVNGRWWLVDPDGYAFYAAGISYINTSGYTSTAGTNPYNDALKAKYGNPLNETAWAADVIDRMRAWGYNTIGPYSSRSLFGKMPYTADLLPMTALRNAVNPSGQRANDAYPLIWEDSRWDADYRRYFFDVFHPLFAPTVQGYITTEITSKRYATDPWLIGYLVDNELPLWHGRRGCEDEREKTGPWACGNTLADVFIALPATTFGKIAWVSYLQETYSSIEQLNAQWGTAYASFNDLLYVDSVSSSTSSARNAKNGFLRRIYDTYFATVRTAIRAVDANHLYLGSRFIVGAISNPPELFDEAARYADVISLNYYIWNDMNYDQLKATMNATFATAYRNKPLLVTEYSFAGRDSGQPANHLNGAIVATQEERGRLAADYRRVCAESPNVVGDIWWDWVDPPLPASSWGNEDSNLGVVDTADKPYIRMLYRVYQENRALYARRDLPALTNPIITSSTATSSSTVARDQAASSSDTPPRTLATPVGAYKLYLPAIFKNFTEAGSASISFNLAAPISSARLQIFDSNVHSGNVRTITTGPLTAGPQAILWDGRDNQGQKVGAGTYYYVLKVTTSSGQTDYTFGVLVV